ncbi:alpha/beta fold hydrolase [Thermoactinospora rubra]|uniref:alpha/beta fold hydrolase n=1 Tax=Thermoactinospora rubra TaxID=1088767 RepID=UPI000A11BE85|nr:alpha/beta hydrolase [Thermoactinospora rubra]
MRANANGIEIAYESFGRPGGQPLLLIMGLGSQMIMWDDELCERLAEQGHHVVRYDNRDVGLSTHLTELGAPDLGAVMAGTGTAPYLLADMADDAAGLLDALGWEAAHVVGASMGGMIAQELAIRHPDRVLTLTSIMSTPSPEIGRPTPEAAAVLFSPPARDREAVVAGALEVWRILGSPGYEMDRDRIARIAGLAYDRGHDPAGVSRQLAAVLASGDRTERLAALRIPALVIHGEADPLVQLEGGKATAAAIPGARLVTYPGMGHDLPRPLWDPIIREIAALTASR